MIYTDDFYDTISLLTLIEFIAECSQVCDDIQTALALSIVLGGSKTIGWDPILMLYIKCHEAMAVTITISPYNTTQI